MGFFNRVEDWRWDVADAVRSVGMRHPALCTSTLLALMQAESEGNADARGGQDEVGLFQVVPYGTSPAWRVDRPPADKLTDPWFNIGWAVNHLDGLLKSQDSPYDAVLAYNTGPRGISSAGPDKHRYASNIIAWAKGDLAASAHNRFQAPDIAPVDGSTWDRDRTAEVWGETVAEGSRGCLEEEHLLITADRPTTPSPRKSKGILWLLIAAVAAWGLTRKS